MKAFFINNWPNLSALDLRPFAKQFFTPRGGAEGHSKERILRALIAAPLEGFDTFTALRNRLD